MASSSLVVTWYTPSEWFGRLISFVTRSPVCHIGAAVIMADNSCTYINVGKPKLQLLDHIPQPYFARKTFQLDFNQTGAALAYMHELDGKAYADSIIGTDLVNAVTGLHVELSTDGDQVCSGTVANLAVRAEVDSIAAPDQETPASLLARWGHD